jgi:hypothetical protein
MGRWQVHKRATSLHPASPASPVAVAVLHEHLVGVELRRLPGVRHMLRRHIHACSRDAHNYQHVQLESAASTSWHRSNNSSALGSFMLVLPFSAGGLQRPQEGFAAVLQCCSVLLVHAGLLSVGLLLLTAGGSCVHHPGEALQRLSNRLAVVER